MYAVKFTLILALGMLALPAVAQHLRTLLGATPLHAQARDVFAATLQRVLATAESVAGQGAAGESGARQVASALYQLFTAIAMAWEAGRIGSARRMHLAQLVLRERALPSDPLHVADEATWLPALLDERIDGAGIGDGVSTVNLF